VYGSLVAIVPPAVDVGVLLAVSRSFNPGSRVGDPLFIGLVALEWAGLMILLARRRVAHGLPSGLLSGVITLAVLLVSCGVLGLITIFVGWAFAPPDNS
jgi:hypothetical protein